MKVMQNCLKPEAYVANILRSSRLGSFAKTNPVTRICYSVSKSTLFHYLALFSDKSIKLKENNHYCTIIIASTLEVPLLAAPSLCISESALNVLALNEL